MPNSKKPFWKQLARVWVLLTGAYFLWEAANYQGIYAWLAERQIAHFGGYVPLLNFIFLVFLCWLPIWIIRTIARGRSKDNSSQYELNLRMLADAKRFRLFVFCGVGATFAGLLFTLISAFILVPASDTPMQTLSASEFETATIAEGPARIVGGELGTIISFGQDWLFSEKRTVYAPYTLPASGKKATVVFVKLAVSSNESLTQLRNRPAWSGIMIEQGVPGTVRSLYRSFGIRFGDPYFTLYPDIQSVRATYWVQAAQLALLFLLLIFVGWQQSKQVNRLKQRPMEGAASS